MDDYQRAMKFALFVVARAIRGNHIYEYYDDLKIDKEITDIINHYSNDLFDLWDDHLNAADQGCMRDSLEYLEFIIDDPLLSHLFIYYFAKAKYSESSND